MDELTNQVPATAAPSLVKAELSEVADMCKNDLDITSALSDKTVDNMKAFLIVYSRSQLNRVVTLTNKLNILEDQLITKVDNKDEVDPELLMSVIKVIQKSLDSAIGLIKQVTSDESYLQVIVSNTQVVQNNLSQYNIITNNYPALANQDSRDKVRTAISTILSKVNELEDINNNKVGETVEIIQET